MFTKEDLESFPEMGSDPIPGLLSLIISEQGVLKQLSSLNPNKACDPDQIPPWFLKTFATDISPKLTDIFQDSIDSGIVPHRWKEANACAVFKHRHAKRARVFFFVIGAFVELFTVMICLSFFGCDVQQVKRETGNL